MCESLGSVVGLFGMEEIEFLGMLLLVSEKFVCMLKLLSVFVSRLFFSVLDSFRFCILLLVLFFGCVNELIVLVGVSVGLLLV